MTEIQLWKNRSDISDKVTIIDDEDYEKVVEAIGRRKWYVHNNGSTKDYAMSGDRRNSIHRVVMGNPKGMCVDHINGDPLDNRKQNLRICTKAQNSQNKKLRCDSASGFKGVYKHSGRLKKPWHAYIGDTSTAYPKKRHINLGYHSTAEEAAMVYDAKAKELHGEFAYLNFPDE
jgi:hypothetical protein